MREHIDVYVQDTLADQLPGEYPKRIRLTFQHPGGGPMVVRGGFTVDVRTPVAMVHLVETVRGAVLSLHGWAEDGSD